MPIKAKPPRLAIEAPSQAVACARRATLDLIAIRNLAVRGSRRNKLKFFFSTAASGPAFVGNMDEHDTNAVFDRIDSEKLLGTLILDKRIQGYFTPAPRLGARWRTWRRHDNRQRRPGRAAKPKQHQR